MVIGNCTYRILRPGLTASVPLQPFSSEIMLRSYLMAKQPGKIVPDTFIRATNCTTRDDGTWLVQSSPFGYTTHNFPKSGPDPAHQNRMNHGTHVLSSSGLFSSHMADMWLSYGRLVAHIWQTGAVQVLSFHVERCPG